MKGIFMIDKMSDNGGAEKKKDVIISREEYSSLIEKGFDSLLMGDFGLSIITGEAGVGKTFLVNKLKLRLKPNHYYIYYIVISPTKINKAVPQIQR